MTRKILTGLAAIVAVGFLFSGCATAPAPKPHPVMICQFVNPVTMACMDIDEYKKLQDARRPDMPLEPKPQRQDLVPGLPIDPKHGA